MAELDSRTCDIEGSVTIRREWEELNAQPLHPGCPLVIDIDVAHTALEHAREAGVITQEAARDRIATLQLRRLIVSAAQARHGCPRAKFPPDHVTPPGELFTCFLPVGRAETFAFGDMNQAGVLLNPKKGSAGFKRSE